MKRISVTLIVLISCLAIFSQETIDYLNVGKTIKFGKQKFSLAWSSHPTDYYYIQEWLPKGEDFDNYSQIRRFIDENRDNFAFLTTEQQEAVVALKAINTDEEPWNKMPSYKKLMKNLNGQLQEKKRELIDAITTKYNAVFSELEKYADDMHVARDKFAKRDITISLKSQTNNFYALQANANTSEFYEEQMRKINAAIVIPTPPADPDEREDVVRDDGGQPTPPLPRPRVRKVVKLNTHTTEPMHTEADIDLYLQSLKVQLMQYLSDDNDIIVN